MVTGKRMEAQIIGLSAWTTATTTAAVAAAKPVKYVKLNN